MTRKRREDEHLRRGLQEAGPAGTWQAHKSANMRRLILDAAMLAIVEHGYARVTTQIIVERAGVSRGAMLHHFPKKQDLLAALVRHIFERRASEYEGELAAHSDTGEAEDVRALEVYWAHSDNDSFLALIELTVAARTDEQLAAAFSPVYDTALQEGYAVRIASLADWANDTERFETAADIVRCLVMGAAITHGICSSQQRRERILSFAKDAVVRLRPQRATA